MKQLLSGSILAMAVLAAGCSSDNFDATGGGETSVQFTAQLPAGLYEASSSRAFSDGLKATRLSYAVYEQGASEKLVINDNSTFTDLTATVSLRLTRGKSYEIVFWADVPTGSAYTFNPESKTVTVDYNGITSSDESRDAFFATTSVTVTDASSKTVELKRPFAQLNFGTEDITDAQIDPDNNNLTTAVTVNAYRTLNLSTGAVTDPVSVTYAAAKTPGPGEKFPGDNKFYYLSMNYILCGAEKSLQEVAFTVNDGTEQLVERTFANIPLQRNYRTNITGKLLTDATTFIVTINPAFEGEAGQGEEENKTPSTQSKEPQKIGNNYQITDASELTWVSENTEKIDWENTGLTFTKDIDMGGAEVEPILIPETVNPVVIDGGGHSVKNYTFKSGATDNVGLFGSIGNGNVSNLRVDGVEFAGTDIENLGALAGTITGKVNNVSASNIRLSGAKNAGAIAGTIAGGTSVQNEGVVEFTEVTFSDIRATQSAGGVAGVLDNSRITRSSAEFFTLNETASTENTIYSSMNNNTGALAGSAVSRNAIYLGQIYIPDDLNAVGGGATVQAIVIDDVVKDGSTYLVATYSQLVKAFSQLVNNETVKLTRDINLYGVKVEPILIRSLKNCTMDGNGHKIHNFSLSVNAEVDNASFQGASLFYDNDYSKTNYPYHNNFTIKNLTVADVVLDGKYEAVVINKLHGTMTDVTVENCTVNSSSSTFGVLCGIHYAGKIEDCRVNGCNVKAKEYLGLLTGQCANDFMTYSNCEVSSSSLSFSSDIEGLIGPFVGATLVANVRTPDSSSPATSVTGKITLVNCRAIDVDPDEHNGSETKRDKKFYNIIIQ